MQKKIIALAVTALVSGAAFAQSSNVTIYGLIDMGASHRSDNVTKGVKSKNSIDSGITSGSRLGFRGTEDLGNGWSALFGLEMGFVADTGNHGQSSRVFGRNATVGLTNKEVGTFVVGRMYTPHYTFLSAIDPFKAGTVGRYNNLMATSGVELGNETLFDPVRVDNTLAYVSPSFGGFNITAAYSNSATWQENLENAGDAKVFALLPRYTNGPLDVGLSWHRIKVSDGAYAPNGVATPVIEPKITNYVLGGTYDFGAVKLHAFYDRNKLSSDTVAVDGKALKSYMVGVTVPFGKSAIQASYGQSRLKANSDADTYKARQWALGYTYAFSKRTNFYAAWADISNDDDRAVKMVVGDGTNNGEGYQSGFQLGLKHTF